MTRNQWEKLTEATRRALVARVQRRSGHAGDKSVNLIIEDFLEVCDEYTAEQRKRLSQD